LTEHRSRDLSQVAGWIIDMDGVLYRDTVVIPGAPEFVAQLQADGTPFVLLTNNSTKTPTQYAEKIAEMGIHVPPAQVLTSSLATAAYLLETFGEGAPVYAIGEDGILEALAQAGFVLLRDEEYLRARSVVVGLDRQATFARLQWASLAIRNGAAFIGTNGDRTLPTPLGLIPGNGSLLAFVEAATDTPPFVIGKPQPPILRWAVSQLGLPAERVACLGDRLETDILGGSRVGLYTVFVLSGVSTSEDLARFEPKPDAVFAGPAELLAAWRGR
jgi:4-nitrophenyl phosphatase